MLQNFCSAIMNLQDRNIQPFRNFQGAIFFLPHMLTLLSLCIYIYILLLPRLDSSCFLVSPLTAYKSFQVLEFIATFE